MTPDFASQLRRAVAQPGGASSDFDLNPDARPAPTDLRPAAVLVAFRENGDVLLTKRSARLKHHPGQVAFPGGKQDPGDADLIATALREAQEETGLPPTQVDVLGSLPAHETVTRFAVTPVVALIKGDFVEKPEPGEVADLFYVPFAHVMRPDNYRAEGRYWQGVKRSYYAVPFGPYYIWGATARILRGLAERVRS